MPDENMVSVPRELFNDMSNIVIDVDYDSDTIYCQVCKGGASGNDTHDKVIHKEDCAFNKFMKEYRNG